MSEALIEGKKLCKFFRGRNGSVIRAIHDLDVAIDNGSFTILSGPSGSGKTTLLSMLGCLDRPTSGSLKFRNREISQCSDVELARIRRTIGFLFQDFALIPRLNVIDNITYPLIPRGIRRAERQRRAMELLDRLQLSRQAQQRPEELSGGERQRVAFARALAGNPAVLLADEPTSNLDHATAQLVIDWLGQLHEKQTTIIVSTHDPQVLPLASDLIALHAGRIEGIPNSSTPVHD